MGTSLIQQLQKLAVPQTALVVEEKRKVSLLFDPKEAANFDRETFYELGVHGFEELKKLNPIFEQFEETLFDVSSKDFQRAVQTEDTNKKLDIEITKFFSCLSPYFLLKCAHKTLEWLIQRFQIHKYNVDQLMMLILPYHESNIFVRVVQIIKIKEPTHRWHWLHPLQNAGVPLSKTALLNHCATSNFFLSFVCNVPLTAMKMCGEYSASLHTLCTFCCMTVVGAIEHSKGVSEIQVTLILKLLIETLTSPFLEFSCMSIVIAAELARTTKLSEKILLVLINKLSKVPHKSVEPECCAVLALFYVSQQETLNQLPDKALTNFAKSGTFIFSLQKIIDGGGDASNFIAVLIKESSRKLLIHDKNHENLQNFVESLVATITFEEGDAENIISIIIDSYIFKDGSKSDDSDVDAMDCDDTSGNDTNENDSAQNVLQWYSSLLRSLERQYATAFDTVVKKVLETTKDERKRRSLLDILGFMPRINFQLSGVDMFEKLHHPSVSMRVEGIKYLLASFDKLREEDTEFVKNILRNRLQEDSYKVVLAVLECPASLLASMVGEEFFVKQLIKISSRFWHMPQISNTSKRKVVSCLCSDVSYKTKEIAVLLAVLPYMLPKRDEDIPLAVCALKSDFASRHKLMLTILKEIPDPNSLLDADILCSIVLKLITDKKYTPNIKDLMDTINEIPIFKTEPVYKFIGTILMAAAVTKLPDVDIKWTVLDTILEYYATSNVNYAVSSTSLFFDGTTRACMRETFKRELPIQGLFYCLHTLTSTIKLPDSVTCHRWWHISSMDKDFRKSSSLFFVKLFEVLVVGCMDSGYGLEYVRKAYVSNLKCLFKDNFPNLSSQLGFLSNLWVSHELGEAHKFVVNYELQLRSLLLARSLLEKTDESIGWTMNVERESIIPPLLISLSCPMAPVRVAALKCFGTLRNSFGASLNNQGYHCLLAKLLDYEEELKLDANQISIILYKVLSPDPAVLSGVSNAQRSKLATIRNALFDCAIHDETPLHTRAALLKILIHVNSQDIMKKLAPVGQEILSFAASNGSQVDLYRSVMLNNILSRFDNTTYSSLTKHKEIWDLLETALFDYKSLVYENSKITCPSIMAMNQISKELFDALPKYQQTLLSILVRVATEADSPDVISVVGHVVKKVVLDCKYVVLELQKICDAQCPPTPLPLGSRRRSQSSASRPSVELLKTSAWREGTTLLELIQNKKKLHSVHLLFPVLFDLLKRCLDFEEQAPVEYIKQLILSCILHCCQKLSVEAEGHLEDVSQREINVELVVQCIRASQNPQTHHHALLVLSQLAGMIPEQVLHNIMAIFTFMGSSILRQDDAYSFQIISKVVDTVIPILVKASDTGVEVSKLYDPVAGVLRVFVDALIDIPEHRQMPLFHKLAVTLGAENFLWLLMALVIESHVRQRTGLEQTKDGFLPKKLEFIVNLMLKFHPSIVIMNSIHLLQYLESLPIEKDHKDRKTNIHGVTKLFDVSNSSRSEFHHFKYAIIIFLSGMIGNSNFISQVAALSEKDVNNLEPLYSQLIERVLKHIQASVRASEVHVGKPTAKFWKCMLGQSYELLDKVNALLLSDMFLHVILSLLDNPIHTVRRKAMELMNARLQNEEFFISCNTEDLLSLINPLLKIINSINEKNTSLDEQLNQQTALASMKLLARLMAAKHTSLFGEILDTLTGLIKEKTLQGNVLACALLCGAELCNCLRAFAVSYLPKFMPALLKVFKKEKKTENPDVVLLAIVTAIYKVVESLPHFLSPYLEKLLTEVSVLSSRFSEEKENQKIAPIVVKLDLVRQKLSSEVPLRILVPVVNTSYFHLLEKNKYGALGPLMSILADSFANVSSADFNHLRTDLSNFFMAALQFRSENILDENQEVVDAVETHVIKALVALVLKLSESSFRPLYYNLYHWATAVDGHKVRLITFYRVSHSIAECLKGLFVLFAGHFIKNAASLLEQTNKSKSSTLLYGNDASGKTKSLLLLDAVLKTLHSVFLYDSAQFLNKERFDTLMQPLVDQLDNTLGGLDKYKERASSLLSPCIVQFAVVTADDSLWKQLIYQILLKTRHSLPVVRLMALETVCGVARKLGEDYLPQLPETMPFLAELMEDEEEEVESACIKAVQEMEEVLGESLKKYL